MTGFAEQVFPTPLPDHPLRVWTVMGTRPGPTLALIGAVHGDELEGPFVLSELLATIDPARLAGQLIVCPVANADAVNGFARASPSDGLNLARCFPGDPGGTYTQTLAALIATHVIGPADVLIDLHSGGQALEAAFFAGYCDLPGPVGAQARMIAMAFGAPFVWRHPPPLAQGRTLSEAAKLGIPAIYVEATGGLFPSPARLGDYARGVDRVMIHLAMVSGDLAPVAQSHVTGAGDLDHAVLASQTGLCTAHVAPMERLEPGQLCFTITPSESASPTEVRAGAGGLAMFTRRARWVRKGDLLLAMAEPE